MRTNTLTVFFSKNNYNDDFIRRNTHRPTATTERNDAATPTTTATILYIKGMSENILRILQLLNIRVAHDHDHTATVTNVKETNRGTGRERFPRSIAPTATPTTSERLAET